MNTLLNKTYHQRIIHNLCTLILNKNQRIIQHLLNRDIGQQLIFDGNDFITPKKVFEYGIIACCQCGKFLSIDSKYCDECHQIAIFIVDDEK